MAAYYDISTITAVKSFVLQAPDEQVDLFEIDPKAKPTFISLLNIFNPFPSFCFDFMMNFCSTKIENVLNI
jgi:hypothetical protein